jgi:hypothetical protein
VAIRHRYLSTACYHREHVRCRLTCKFCETPCICDCHSVLEARIPELNPWAGMAVVAMHNHTAEQPCISSCTEYYHEQKEDR